MQLASDYVLNTSGKGLQLPNENTRDVTMLKPLDYPFLCDTGNISSNCSTVSKSVT